MRKQLVGWCGEFDIGQQHSMLLDLDSRTALHEGYGEAAKTLQGVEFDVRTETTTLGDPI
jgi:hypothetical protein